MGRQLEDGYDQSVLLPHETEIRDDRNKAIYNWVEETLYIEKCLEPRSRICHPDTLAKGLLESYKANCRTLLQIPSARFLGSMRHSNNSQAARNPLYCSLAHRWQEAL